jgi:hypothetical protein
MAVEIPEEYYFTSIEQWNHNETLGIRWYSTNQKRDFVLVVVSKEIGKDDITIESMTDPIPIGLVDAIRWSGEDFESWVRRGRP